MINVAEKSKCSGCYACAQICPKKCITMVSDAEGFLYPNIDTSACIQCGACEKACPVLTPRLPIKDKQVTAYAAIYKNDTLRLHSSSGGVFSALASYVIERGGVVFGAAFDKEFKVIHKYVEKIEDLASLRGSKYVQSEIGTTYFQAEEFLKAGRMVLFSGTPCQIEGLLSYLKKPYENLITQDLICHGVPTPKVWQKYVEYREETHRAKPREIAFRAKDEGWKRYSMSFAFENDRKYRATLDKDPMLQIFLKNLCLRPSCYDCSFKKKERLSDITLADFWGIENVSPKMDDDKGTSLVVIHSKKGQQIFEGISDFLEFTETDIDKAISYNLSMIKSVAVPKKRKDFFEELNKNPVKAIKRHGKVSPLKRALQFAGKVLRRIKNIILR